MASTIDIAVLGAGQIGTRHVQSLATSELDAEIWVVDPSTEARRLLATRLAEVGVEDSGRVRSLTDLSALPNTIDVAVIATNSEGRLAALEQLLMSRRVRWIILEKFLFPRASDYSRAAKILEESGTGAFVNCPRRLFDGYAHLKREIEGPIRIRVSGVNWGLACNSVHWLDLLNFLRPSNEYRIKSSLTEPTNAKRPGYVEFYGRVEIADADGNRLEMICDDDGPVSAFVEIDDASGRHWEISEQRGQITSNQVTDAFSVPFQSQLTARVVRMLLEREACELASYQQSARLHKVLLDVFLRAYNAFNSSEGNDLCPIT